jgi:hypothetical protein
MHASFELVYHRTSGAASPFDAALREVVDDALVARLTSPYIGLQYLRSLLRGVPFELVTDLDEWLRSSPRQVPAILGYLESNEGSIRHLAGLHAKVAIGQTKAYLGSANFTRAGLSRRDEMSVVLRDSSAVAELTEWFNRLWSRAVQPDLAELHSLAASYAREAPSAPNSRLKLKSTGERIRAALSLDAASKPTPEAVPDQTLPTEVAPATESEPPRLNYSFKRPPGLFSRLVQDLQASLDPTERHEKLVSLARPLLNVGSTLRRLLKEIRKADSWAKARDLARALEEQDCLRSLLNPAKTSLARVGHRYFDQGHLVISKVLADLDRYLAWMVSRLSPDEYRDMPKSELAAEFDVSLELARKVVDELIAGNFIAEDEIGRVVLTGEGTWGDVQQRFPRFAIAWQKQGLDFDAPAAQMETTDTFEEFLLLVIDTLDRHACPREASRWDRIAPHRLLELLKEPGRRQLLQELLLSSLAHVVLDTDVNSVVVLNRNRQVAHDLANNGFEKAAQRVMNAIPNPALAHKMGLGLGG